MSSVVRQVHLAFRPVDQDFEGSHETLAVRAERRGRFQLTPFDPRSGTHGKPLSFETLAAVRGNVSLWSQGASRIDDGAIAIDRGAFTERLANTELGVEQSFHFAQSPAGSGDLLVSVAVLGAGSATTTSEGVHFQQPQGGLGVRYGHATWVDATGARTPLPVALVNSALVLRVPAEVLARSRYPAILDPLISPERAVGDAILAPPPEGQSSPAIAFDGSRYVVVWSDRRSTWQYDLYAARVAVDGTILNPAGIAIAWNFSNQSTPAVACDGAGACLVAWTYSSSGIRVATLDASGTVHGGPDGMPPGLAVAGTNNSRPALAWAGGSYLLAWTGAPQTMAAWLAPNGTVLAPGAFATLASGSQPPAVACEPAVACVVASASSGDLLAARLPVGQSTPAALALPVLPGAQASPALSFSDGGFLLAFEDAPAAASNVTVLRLTSLGAVTSTATVSDTGASRLPRLAAGAGKALLLWQEGAATTDVHGALLTTGAGDTLAAGAAFPVDAAAQSQASPVVASDGANYLVAYADNRAYASAPDIRTSRVLSDGSVSGPGGLLSASAGLQLSPRVAFDGSRWLVVWSEYRTGNRDIFATRVDRDGTVVDLAGIPVSLNISNEDEPAVAFGAGRYLVTFLRAGAGLVATPVLPDGTLLPEKLLGSGIVQRVASDGASFLVLAQDAAGVQAIPVAADGTAAAKILLGVNGTPSSVTSSGSQWLATWQASTATYPYSDVGAARLAAGTYVPTAVSFGASTEARYAPVAVNGGSQFLVMWQAGSRLYGSRVTQAGVVLDPGGAVAPGTPNLADAAFDGHDYLFLYRQYSSGLLSGSRVSSSLATLESGFPVSSGLSRQGGIASVSCDGEGSCLAVYERYEPSLGTRRVFGKVLKVLGPGQACIQAGDCASTFCVDGVCCDSACGGGVGGDCMACSTVAGAQVDGSCGPVAAGTVCRGAGGGCDVEEKCSGSSTSCPVDGFVTAGIPCRAAAGDCDLAETCTGAAASCPADGFATAGIPCRAAAGDCDLAETCTGAAASCPADGFATAGTTCRAAAGDCDLAETCTGAAASCPADGFATAGIPCRAAAGDCDLAETCTGAAASCPADGFATAGIPCRAAAGDCDLAETCTGAAASCPADGFATAGTTCRAVAGDCDLAETCTGAAANCPADGFVTAGIPCRAAAGDCDLAEKCTGAAASCPADGFATAGTTCRAAAGDCDLAETCTGAAASCPADGFATAGTTCRAAAGDCDLAETCTGAAASCPADGFATAGTTCRSAAGDCDLAETCTGAAASCPADGFATAGTTCRGAAGDCDLAETCTGAAASCPADGFATAGTTCRVAAGDCDLAEICTGTAASCPADGVATAGTTCRAAVGDCDTAEACTGTAKVCPPDAFLAAGTPCRAGACREGVSTPAASCDGSRVCPTTTAVSCGDYACAESACRTDCTDSSNCADGRACVGGACVVTDAGVPAPDGSVPQDSGVSSQDASPTADATVEVGDGGIEERIDAAYLPDGAVSDAGNGVAADAELVSAPDGGVLGIDSGTPSRLDASAGRDDLGGPVVVESGCGCGTQSGTSLVALAATLLGLGSNGRRRKAKDLTR
ncbi:MAG: hypothetical protein QM765_36945 [Myxococcales bacterium]